MKNQQIVILLLLASTLASIPLALTVPPTRGSSARHFNLYQNNNTKGVPCSGQTNCFNTTSPGPTITVNQGDTVSITVHDNDSISHTFTIVSAPYTSVDTGTMNPGQVKTLSTFTASTSGTFNYQCSIHPTTMLGTFKVIQVSSTPITSSSLLVLAFTTTAAVYIVLRKRH